MVATEMFELTQGGGPRADVSPFPVGSGFQPCQCPRQSLSSGLAEAGSQK